MTWRYNHNWMAMPCVQVYYGAWRGLEVAVKVMSADTQQVAAGIEVRRIP